MNIGEHASPEHGPDRPAQEHRRATAVRGTAARVLGHGGSRLGLIIIAVGLVVIGVGWNGAAGSGGEVNHVPVVEAQLPWLLSGGFLGLGIIVLGAAMVVANAYRESEARLVARFEQLIGALESESVVATRSSPPATEARGDLVVAGTASFHRPDCRLVKGRAEARLIETSSAVALGLTPCRICRPAGGQPDRLEGSVSSR